MSGIQHAWSLTLGAMRESGCCAKARCAKCQVETPIDAAALAAKVGDDFSLWDRRCRCKLTDGCGGWVSFHYLVHGGFMPMRTDAWDQRVHGLPRRPMSRDAQRIFDAIMARNGR